MTDSASGRVELSGRVIIVALHTRNSPADVEWDEYISNVDQALKSMSGDASKIGGVAITDGGAPNAKQRDKLAAYLKDNRIKGAVLTQSSMVRGVVTAMSWVNPNVRAFSPEKVFEALAHLGVPAAEVQKCWETASVLKQRISAVQTFDAVAKVMKQRLEGTGDERSA